MVGEYETQRIARLTPVDDVLASIEARVAPVAPRAIELAAAIGSILAADAVSSADGPGAARALRDGDVTAFDELYARYHDWVTTLAFRFTTHREDALDVLQDTFAYLHRKRRDFALRSQMKTFLYPVVKHLSLSRALLARRQAPLDPKQDPAAPRPSSDDVASLLSGLSEAQQEVVLMRFVDGLDLQAIADVLDVPLGTVKSRLHSALELLRGKTFPNR